MMTADDPSSSEKEAYLGAGPADPNGTNVWDFQGLTESGNGTGWSWENTTKTLTLTDFTYSSTADVALRVPTDTTIVVIGTNSITSTYNATNNTSGIGSAGNLIITGDGTLTATGGTVTSGGNVSTGISTGGGSGKLTVTGDVTVIAAAGGSAATISSGVYSSGPVEVKWNASLTATGGSSTAGLGIRTSSLTISDNAFVKAVGNSRAISYNYTVPINCGYKISANADGSSPTAGTSSGSVLIDSDILYAEITAAFAPVTNITGVATDGTVGTPVTLSGTVSPDAATNKTIVWSLGTGSTAAGASVSGGNASATGAGTVIVKATIVNGTAPGTDYTKDFTITFAASSVGDDDTTGEDDNTTLLIIIAAVAIIGIICVAAWFLFLRK